MTLKQKARRLRKWLVTHRKNTPRRRRAKRDYNYLKGQLARRVRNKRNGFQPWMLNGHPGNVSLAVKRVIVRGVQAGLVVTSTTDGRSHSRNSYHYRNPGEAVDMAGPYRKMVTFQLQEARDSGRWKELIGPLNYPTVKHGVRWTQREGTPLENSHDNHIHAAPRF